MFTIGIYARKSVYRDNSDSVKVQVQSCKDYAKLIFSDRDIEFKIYDKDEGFSGKNTNRPSYIELMKDVKSNLLDAVMVYKLDRISRNVKDFSETYETLDEHNVAFLSVKENFDTSTPIGRTVMYILAAFAQLERENTSERVADSMLALGASGKWTGGKLPVGMNSIRKTVNGKEHSFLIIDNEQIGFVKMLYRLFLSGYTITKLERYCRDNSIKTKSGKFLSSSQLHCILSNPVYCSNDKEAYYYLKEQGHTVPEEHLFDGKHGLIGYGKTRQTKTSFKSETYTIAIGIHDPVIPATEWIAVQKRFGVNKMYRSNKYEIGILKGVLKCSCGSRMDIRTYSKNGSLFSYYYCANMARKGKSYCSSGYTRVDILDDAFIEKLEEIKLNPDKISLRKIDDITIDVETIKTEIKKIDSAINNLTDALMEYSESSAAEYVMKKIEKLDNEKRTLEHKLTEAATANAAAKSAAEEKKMIFENVCLLLDNFDSMSYTEKNELIKKIVQKCTFDGEILDISF